VTYAEGFHDDIPEADYHSDQGSLSVSGAKTLLKAPALFQWERTHSVHKAAFDFGSAAHALVLGRGMENIYVAPFDDWKTKAAQTEQRIARADGLSPILPKDWAVVCDMADMLSSHTLAMKLLSDGRPEVSAFAEDEETGVMRRGRFDWLGPTILSDYKTTVCANPDVWRNDAARHGCHMQDAWYLDLARDLGHPAQAFAFIVQEKTPPYLVSVVELDEAAVQLGRERNRLALERFRDCTESGVWPGYISDAEFARVSLPKWAFFENEASA